MSLLRAKAYMLVALSTYACNNALPQYYRVTDFTRDRTKHARMTCSQVDTYQCLPLDKQKSVLLCSYVYNTTNCHVLMIITLLGSRCYCCFSKCLPGVIKSLSTLRHRVLLYYVLWGHSVQNYESLPYTKKVKNCVLSGILW